MRGRKEMGEGRKIEESRKGRKEKKMKKRLGKMKNQEGKFMKKF